MMVPPMERVPGDNVRVFIQNDFRKGKSRILPFLAGLKTHKINAGNVTALRTVYWFTYGVMPL